MGLLGSAINSIVPTDKAHFEDITFDPDHPQWGPAYRQRIARDMGLVTRGPSYAVEGGQSLGDDVFPDWASGLTDTGNFSKTSAQINDDYFKFLSPGGAGYWNKRPVFQKGGPGTPVNYGSTYGDLPDDNSFGGVIETFANLIAGAGAASAMGAGASAAGGSGAAGGLEAAGLGAVPGTVAGEGAAAFGLGTSGNNWLDTLKSYFNNPSAPSMSAGDSYDLYPGVGGDGGNVATMKPDNPVSLYDQTHFSPYDFDIPDFGSENLFNFEGGGGELPGLMQPYDPSNPLGFQPEAPNLNIGQNFDYSQPFGGQYPDPTSTLNSMWPGGTFPDITAPTSNIFQQVAQKLGTTVAKSVLGKIANGTATADDYLKIGGQLAATLLSVYGSRQQANSLNSLANQYSAYGAPYRSLLAQSYADPAGYLKNSPDIQASVGQGTDALARALSVQGNPAGSGNALQQLQSYATQGLYGQLGNERNRLANFGGLSSFNSAAPGLAGQGIAANAGIYNAIGSGIASATNPQPSLTDILIALGGGKRLNLNTGSGL